MIKLNKFQLLVLLKVCSTVTLADSVAEPFLNDFHAKNLNLNESPIKSFNRNSVPPQAKIENLKNVNFQISHVEPVDKNIGLYAKNLEVEGKNYEVPIKLQRNIFYSENPTDNLRSDLQTTGRVYTYPKHLQAKNTNSEQDISFRRDSTPVFLQQENPISVPVQDEGEEENVESTPFQDENSQQVVNRYPLLNQVSYFDPSGRPQNLPLVACNLIQKINTVYQYQTVPSCFHVLGYQFPFQSSNFGELEMKKIKFLAVKMYLFSRSLFQYNARAAII